MQLTVAVALTWSLAASFGLAQENVLTVSLPKSGEPPDLHAIRMIDRLRGWTINDLSFLVTVDGARNWKRVAEWAGGHWGVSIDGGAWSLRPPSLRDSKNELLRLGSGGSIEHLTLPCGDKCIVEDIDFDAMGEKGLLIGLTMVGADESAIAVFRTIDGGRRWVSIAAPDATVFRGQIILKWTSDKQALIEVGCQSFTTRDFGDTWQRSPDKSIPDTMCEQDSLPFSIYFVNSRQGWLRTSTGRVFWSDDGGTKWNNSELVEKENPFTGIASWVSFADARRGLIVVDGQVLVTHDGGRTWNPLTPRGERFFAVSCADDRCILRSTNRVAELTFAK